MQGRLVGLGNSHAALLEGRGTSWGEALGLESSWELVDVLIPQVSGTASGGAVHPQVSGTAAGGAAQAQEQVDKPKISSTR